MVDDDPTPRPVRVVPPSDETLVTPPPGVIEPVVVTPFPPVESDVVPGSLHEEERVQHLPDGSVVREYDRVEQPALVRGRDWRPWIITGAILVALLAALGVWYFTRSDQKAVPAILGQPVAAATARLQNAGFKTQVTQRAGTGQPGIVLAAQPAPGEKADKGSVVALVVSAAPATVTVPNAVGLTQTDARDRLVAAGFKVTSAFVSSDLPSGTVTAQAPAAGDKVGSGDAVRINVSKGSATASVPNEVGQTGDSAQQDLAAKGFNPVVVQVASDQAAGTVVAQSPAGGQARKGAKVQLSVSSGPATTTATTDTTPTTPPTSTDVTTTTP